MLSDEKVVILGAGREGLASLEYLSSRYPHLSLVIADKTPFEQLSSSSQEVLQRYPNTSCVLGNNYLAALEGSDVAVRSPGINLRLPELQTFAQRGGKITSGTKLFLEAVKGRVIGVTGTKGKSTTSSLLAHLLTTAGLNVRLIGNIGHPALHALSNDTEGITYVYEMSSYQLEDCEGLDDKGSLALGIMLNFYPEHLDYHGSLEQYYTAKLRMVEALGPDGVLVYGSYSPDLVSRLKHYSFKGVPCPGSRVEVDGQTLKVNREPVISLSDMHLVGHHNLLNAACALEAALLLGCELPPLAEGMRTFQPLPHRLQRIGTFKEIQFINDSIATTPEATIAALRAMSAPVGTLICGGLDRGYNFSALAQEILDCKITALIALPGSGTSIGNAVLATARPGERSPAIYPVPSMADAVRVAYETTPSGHVCLLSCASPSYNVFKNFEDRGMQFAEEARRQSLGSHDN